ncbi:MAG: glutamate racemase [Erysipelotrichaceae bacterium]|nr:glutamate racemase [Erysipelotrichaceae bacterium]
MKIGFFDSGFGGLSVLHEALQLMPDQQYLFFADQAHVPYGEKTKEEIIRYTDDSISFLIKQGCEAIVVACNTATSAAVEILRRKYDIPIVSMEPAVKKALEEHEGKCLVMATPYTLQGDKLHNLLQRIDGMELATLLPMPMLVRFAENRQFTGEEVTEYIRKQISVYDFSEYGSVVLGCTHFNYFKDTLRNLLPPHVAIVDGNEGTVRQLKRRLPEQKEEEHPSVTYYISGDKVTDATMLKTFEQLLIRLDDMREIR